MARGSQCKCLRAFVRQVFGSTGEPYLRQGHYDGVFIAGVSIAGQHRGLIGHYAEVGHQKP